MHKILVAVSFLIPGLVSATILASYDASRGDVVENALGRSAGGLQNLAGWDNVDWPSGQAQNSSCFFTTGTDPQGRPAAHVHKSAHFSRSEYHVLNKRIDQSKTYYIGYRVQWVNVDYQTIVFQWKSYETGSGVDDTIPIGLVFRSDADGSGNHTINFGCQPDPTTGHGTTVWTKQLQMGKIYQFGIVINTTPSMTGGWVQLYYQGNLATMIHPTTGEHVQKISGNFFPTPGYANPKLGLYGGKNNLADDSYVYNFIVGTELADIADVAGISV